MGYRTVTLNVMLSGPGDGNDDLKTVESLAHEWNRANSESLGVA